MSFPGPYGRLGGTRPGRTESPGMTTIREAAERLEEEHLSPRAAQSSASRGRERPEAECPIRTAFQRDRDRVVHSKAFRRLKGKTQVFLSPRGDHYRTRLTHSLEVSQVGRTIARALRLNEDLVETIALGHDLGHTPFGHAGEAALDQVMPGGFRHNEQSLRVVTDLEREGEGLNLTWEVRDGILCHVPERAPATLEGQIVQLADRSFVLLRCHHHSERPPDVQIAMGTRKGVSTAFSRHPRAVLSGGADPGYTKPGRCCDRRLEEDLSP